MIQPDDEAFSSCRNVAEARFGKSVTQYVVTASQKMSRGIGSASVGKLILGILQKELVSFDVDSKRKVDGMAGRLGQT